MRKNNKGERNSLVFLLYCGLTVSRLTMYFWQSILTNIGAKSHIEEKISFPDVFSS
jgi:hypothetical protein